MMQNEYKIMLSNLFWNFGVSSYPMKSVNGGQVQNFGMTIKMEQNEYKIMTSVLS